MIKLEVQWPDPYQVIGKGGKHGKPYHLKHIHRGNVPGTHHGYHLKLYHHLLGRLRQPFDDEPHIGPEAVRSLRRRQVSRMLKAGRTIASLGLQSFAEFWEGVRS